MSNLIHQISPWTGFKVMCFSWKFGLRMPSPHFLCPHFFLLCPPPPYWRRVCITTFWEHCPNPSFMCDAAVSLSKGLIRFDFVSGSHSALLISIRTNIREWKKRDEITLKLNTMFYSFTTRLGTISQSQTVTSTQAGFWESGKIDKCEHRTFLLSVHTCMRIVRILIEWNVSDKIKMI